MAIAVGAAPGDRRVTRQKPLGPPINWSRLAALALNFLVWRGVMTLGRCLMDHHP